MVSFDWRDAPPHIIRRIGLMPLESTIDRREHAERVESELARYREASAARRSKPQASVPRRGSLPQDDCPGGVN